MTPAALACAARSEPSIDACEEHYRNLARSLFLIVGENRHLLRLLIIESLALAHRRDGRADLEAVGAKLNRRQRVRDQIVIPGRAMRRTGERGDHHDAIAVARVA